MALARRKAPLPTFRAYVRTLPPGPFVLSARDDGELPTRSWEEVHAHLERFGAAESEIATARAAWNAYVIAYRQDPGTHLVPGFETDIEALL